MKVEVESHERRNCAYHEEFAKEKLVWIELVQSGRFAYDDSGVYCEATTFIMTGERIKYLCAVLNTKLIRWYIQQVAPTSGTGTLRWKKVYIETSPISPVIPQNSLIAIKIEALVDEILVAKQANLNADTTEEDMKIAQLVYKLYGLTEKEIQLIEG